MMGQLLKRMSQTYFTCGHYGEHGRGEQKHLASLHPPPRFPDQINQIIDSIAIHRPFLVIYTDLSVTIIFFGAFNPYLAISPANPTTLL